MDDLQERLALMEMIIKSKDDELVKKHNEVYRLERELYLMEDLLAGYRKALNDTRYKFPEYRKCVAFQEEPLYKDAGHGGLVFSTRELEKRRLKQEDMMKFQTLAKSFEEECVYQLEIQGERALKMAERLVFVGNEVKRLKEIATQRKETRKPRELSPKPEENQKLLEEHESSLEPEENQKSLDKLELSPEPEENQKSLDKMELSPKPEENQNYHPSPDNDASMESVPPDDDESKEKVGGEEQ
ncbi:hypothetical protein L1987_12646 [Smallanthus sonchifolius]|uniref:Uncharacterized protein n=1 Tax=Smallanthus sonchifolius TaxID=185202 RepID=A0ACB9JGZ1_9ASTR|nr:hypothetical protein L1987_12646 [Smallanthus sonchifolius]